MYRRFLLAGLTTVGLLYGSSSTSDAAPFSVVAELGPATGTGTTRSFTVSATIPVGPSAGFGVVLFGFDLSNSSAALTGGGTYSPFSFALAPALQGTWQQIAALGNAVSPGYFEYDTVLSPLAAGTHTLGTLTLDLTAAGVTADPALNVAINGVLTTVGGEDVPTFPFDYYPVTFNPGVRPLSEQNPGGPGTGGPGGNGPGGGGPGGGGPGGSGPGGGGTGTGADALSTPAPASLLVFAIGGLMLSGRRLACRKAR